MTESGSVAFYVIQPENGAGLFLQPGSPHGAPGKVDLGRTDRRQLSLYLSVSDASQQLVPALVDVVSFSDETLSGHRRLSAQCVGQVSQQLNVVVMVVRLDLEHLYSQSPVGTHWLTVWCSGNALVSINAVALHRARLVLGWVTVFGQVNCLIT